MRLIPAHTFATVYRIYYSHLLLCGKPHTINAKYNYYPNYRIHMNRLQRVTEFKCIWFHPYTWLLVKVVSLLMSPRFNLRWIFHYAIPFGKHLKLSDTLVVPIIVIKSIVAHGSRCWEETGHIHYRYSNLLIQRWFLYSVNLRHGVDGITEPCTVANVV